MDSYAIIFSAAAVFIVAERVLPGRKLQTVPGWYARAAVLNGCQLTVTLIAGVTWNEWFDGQALFHLVSRCRQYHSWRGGWYRVYRPLTGEQ